MICLVSLQSVRLIFSKLNFSSVDNRLFFVFTENKFPDNVPRRLTHSTDTRRLLPKFDDHDVNKYERRTMTEKFGRFQVLVSDMFMTSLEQLSGARSFLNQTAGITKITNPFLPSRVTGWCYEILGCLETSFVCKKNCSNNTTQKNRQVLGKE